MNWFKKLLKNNSDTNPSEYFEEAANGIADAFISTLKIANSGSDALDDANNIVKNNTKDNLDVMGIKKSMLKARKMSMELSLIAILSRKLYERIDLEKSYEMYTKISNHLGIEVEKLSDIENDMEKIIKGEFNLDESG